MLSIHCANSIQYIAASFLLKLCSTNSSLRTKKNYINVYVWVYKPLFMISAVVAKNEYTKRSQRILNTEIESIIMRKMVKGFCFSIPFIKHMHTFACIGRVCVCAGVFVRVCVCSRVCMCLNVEHCQYKRDILRLFVEVKPVGYKTVEVSLPFPHGKFKLLKI